ncbi:MAG: L-histidine N(alpha)-methyltransferase [Cyanobacteria bacterium J06638_28]
MPVNTSQTPFPFQRELAQSPLAPVLSRDRLIIEYRTPATRLMNGESGHDVVSGLTQEPKSLPPKYFYDDRGSQLFEAITQLPEYYLTRTERQILTKSAAAIVEQVGPCDLIELGSGSSSKTRILLNAYQQDNCDLRYVPVDVSGGMLEESARALLKEYPKLTIHGLVSTYEAALADLPETTLPCRLIAFIGSTLGNLPPQDCQQFFAQVSQALKPGDYFLLGVDLQKDKSILEAAYNDQQGITAEFNLNMLNHLNWRFQGNFDTTQFRHVAAYSDREHQIEMYIESLQDQTITLKALNLQLRFTAGERLLSEISRKFKVTTLAQELMKHRLHITDTFTDESQWFALVLCQRQ